MMSAKQDTSNGMMSGCASCGAEGDDIQLMTCAACKSARYCSVACQRNHWPKHKKACKMRAAELRDEILFKQPEGTHLGDCPICFLPIPNDPNGSVYHTCCSKIVCKGCVVVNICHEMKDRLEHTCPFCRDAIQTGEGKQKLMKRIQANDPSAMCQLGMLLFQEGQFEKTLEYNSKAAELGDAHAHYVLSEMYERGQTVGKDEKKELYHLEEAAIKGHNKARFNLGAYELRKGRIDRAVKHLVIAANLGDDNSMQRLKRFYADGDMSKEDFASALRAYQAAVNATKSPQREAVKD